MKKILVVYYSRTGNTRTVAECLATACDADLDFIEDDAPYKRRYGLLGYLKCAFEALFKRTVPICSLDHVARRYDLVIVGTPIWFWSMSSPVRTYIQHHRREFKNVAYFCTYGGAGQNKVLDDLQRLGGRPSIAHLAIQQSEVSNGSYVSRVAEFVASLKKVTPLRLPEIRPQPAPGIG